MYNNDVNLRIKFSGTTMRRENNMRYIDDKIILYKR